MSPFHPPFFFSRVYAEFPKFGMNLLTNHHNQQQITCMVDQLATQLSHLAVFVSFLRIRSDVFFEHHECTSWASKLCLLPTNKRLHFRSFFPSLCHTKFRTNSYSYLIFYFCSPGHFSQPIGRSCSEAGQIDHQLH